MIPSCLIGNEILEVLNLRRNKLSATIPGEFSGNCLLRTLDLNGNLLEGKIPESLANCKELEVLNLGNNQMSDFFSLLVEDHKQFARPCSSIQQILWTHSMSTI